MKTLIEAYLAAIEAISNRATLQNTRGEVYRAEQAAGVEVKNGVFAFAKTGCTKAVFVAYCKACIAKLVEEAHAEALAIDADMPASFVVAGEGSPEARLISGVQVLVQSDAAREMSTRIVAEALSCGYTLGAHDELIAPSIKYSSLFEVMELLTREGNSYGAAFTTYGDTARNREMLAFMRAHWLSEVRQQSEARIRVTISDWLNWLETRYCK